jgi:DNA-binding transcriptional LysR family regulator
MPKDASQQLTLMKTFLRIVSAGSFSMAAKQLCISQPTVSRQLRQLEAHLGIQLLSRTTHGIRLTDAGRRYHVYAHTLAEELDKFESELRSDADLPCGLLRVVVPSGVSHDRLIEIAARYLKKYPATRLEWRVSDSEVHFKDGDIDCAISIGPPRDEFLIARRLGEIETIVVASPSLMSQYDGVRTPEDLCKLPWMAISGHASNSIHLQGQPGDICKIHISSNFIVDSILVARKAALLGMGATLLPKLDVSQDIELGRLVRVLPEWVGQPKPVYLIYPKLRHYTCKLRKFIDLVNLMDPRLFSAPLEKSFVTDLDVTMMRSSATPAEVRV